MKTFKLYLTMFAILFSLQANATETSTDILMHEGEITLTDGATYNFYDVGGAEENYSNNLEQTLVIKCSANKSTSITIASYELETNCDYLRIYNGSDNTAQLLAELTGIKNTATTITTLNETGSLCIYFSSDGSANRFGWEGTITTTDKPASHQLSFTSEIGTAPEAITVYENFPIGLLPQIESTDTKYNTGWTIDNNPITANTIYSFTENKQATAVWGKCIKMQNNTIILEENETYGFFDTGGENEKYSTDENYTLTIKCPANKLVQVDFTAFRTNSNDVLKIYNGENSSAPLIMELYYDENTTSTITATATNNTGALTFVFVSENYTKEGWEATLKSIDKPTSHTLSFTTEKGDTPENITVYEGLNIASLPYDTLDLYLNTHWKIDGIDVDNTTTYNYTENKQAEAVWENIILMKDANITLADNETYKFYDTGGADKYPSSYEDHTLTINCSSNKLVQIKFTYISVNASNDSILIYDGTSKSAKLIAAISQRVFEEITYTATNSDGALTIIYKTLDYPDDGFQAELKAIDKPTSHTLSFSTSKGATPATQNVYEGINIGSLPHIESIDDQHLICWTIDGDTIYDHTIFDYNTNKQAVAVWEKAVVMHTGEITIADNETVKFYDSGLFYNNYSAHEGHYLKINCSEGKLVQIKFEKLITESCDNIYIYDGADNSEPLIAELSDEISDSTITATNQSGTLYLFFHSDGSYEYKGWDATITTIDNPMMGIETQNANNNLTAYKSTTGITIQGLTEGKEFKIFSIDGKMIYSATATNQEQTVNIAQQGIIIICSNKKAIKINN